MKNGSNRDHMQRAIFAILPILSEQQNAEMKTNILDSLDPGRFGQ